MPISPISNLSVSRYEYALQSVRRLRSSLPSPVVFDIGAGNGRMKGPVEATGCVWYGFDQRPASPGITLWNLDEPCPVRMPRAGMVLLLDVIEHLINPGLALKHIADVLHPGGQLVLTVPNPRWSRSRIHALLHGVPACFTETDLELNGHVFTPWPHILMRMLSDTGFEVEDYVTLDGKSEWPGRPISLRYPLRLLHALGNKVVERFDASACGMSYGLAARIRNDERSARRID